MDNELLADPHCNWAGIPIDDSNDGSDGENLGDDEEEDIILPPPEVPEEREHDDNQIFDSPNGKSVGDEFLLALGIFCTALDMSTTQYASLYEVLGLLARNPKSFERIPRTLATVKRQLSSVLPILTIRGKEYTPDAEQLPPKHDNPSFTFYFSLRDLANTWLNNPEINAYLHLGLGEWVDDISEIWHGDLWKESLRTSSGQFARLEDDNNTVVIPSDCVYYTLPEFEVLGASLIGRITGIGIDKRNGQNIMSACLTQLIPVGDLHGDLRQEYKNFRPDLFKGTLSKHRRHNDLMRTPELVLFEHSSKIIPISCIKGVLSVAFLDHSPLELDALHGTSRPSFHVATIVYEIHTINRRSNSIRSIDQRHRLVAENEIFAYGKDTLLKVKPETHVSLPYTTFIDDFGFYRNAHHSLAGVYITPAGLPLHLREKLHNANVWTIGPFGADNWQLAETLKADSINADYGVPVLIFKENAMKIASVFCVSYIGDMPQQNKNAGCKSQKAIRGCRSCFLSEDAYGDLDQDVRENGRYAGHMKHLRREYDKLNTVSAKDKFATTWGISERPPPFQILHPSLDVIRAAPVEPMHAEFRLNSYFNSALVEGVLTTKGVASLRLAWECMDIPYAWGRPHNPVSHKGSMNFSEHARIACLQPFILMRVFATQGSLIKPKPLAAYQRSLQSSPADVRIVYDYIIAAAFKMAQSNFYTFKTSMTVAEQDALNGYITEGRNAYIWFMKGLTDLKEFKNKWKVPNVHTVLHYPSDIADFAIPRNTSCSTGERKHKIFKQHAPHTNSKKQTLQLLRSVNTTQGLRHVIDGAYEAHPTYAALTSHVRNILDQCPNLRSSIIGPSIPSPVNDDNPIGSQGTAFVDTTDTLFAQVQLTGVRARVPSSVIDEDLEPIRRAYLNYFNVDMSWTIRAKIKYWQTCRITPAPAGQSPCILLRLNSIIQLTNGFAMLKRIISIQVGALIRVLFEVDELERNPLEEYWAAKYEVWRTTDVNPILLPLCNILPARHHFISKSEGWSWWRNHLLVDTN